MVNDTKYASSITGDTRHSGSMTNDTKYIFDYFASTLTLDNLLQTLDEFTNTDDSIINNETKYG